MNFSRLLATGRSLIGVRNTDSPYRMRKGTLLPKFESVKNPFVTPAKSEVAAGAKLGGLAGASQAAQLRAQAVKSPGGPLQTSLLFEEQSAKPDDGSSPDKALAPMLAEKPSGVKTPRLTMLPPAHEPGEIPRESVPAAGGRMVLPLPGGEGRGEGGRPTEISPPRFIGAMRVKNSGRSLLEEKDEVRAVVPSNPNFTADGAQRVDQGVTAPFMETNHQCQPSAEALPTGRGEPVEKPRLVEVYSVKEVARMTPVPPARKETVIARVGSVEAAPEPPPVREGVSATPSAKPAKAAPVVGLMDASPLGLKTGVAPKGGSAAPAPVARPEAKSNFLAAFVKKINPLAYLPERKIEGPKMRAWQTRAVVQTELSLENVKVIRNELNDTDLEVVPARTAAKPAMAGLRLQPIARSENTTIGRLTSRFFGQDQPAGSLK